jgi:predicted DNA-binding ribbon-helix-helix protein
VPISWIGDALCNFGVPPPIQWTARMGDLIDGEQAFEILEAMHGWDHSIMYDMYTWDSLRELAASHELDLGDVLQVCDEEGFALPFGLRSHLRVEQYARLMRRLGRAKDLPDDVREKFRDPDYPSV